ncbi:MAG: hypothetical protein HKN17_04560 [Rhodothermales bacterium]|nr:hypothetical protein [Rhodothermales bacterium]
MDQIFDYTIPVLHPVVVHFPIALSVAAAVCAWVWLASDRVVWLQAVFYLSAGAFAGAVAAWLTGEEMEEQSEGVSIVETFVETHEALGLWSMISLGVVAAVAVLTIRYVRHDASRAGAAPVVRWTMAVLVTAAAVLIGVTAHFGGIMVWGVPG